MQIVFCDLKSQVHKIQGGNIMIKSRKFIATILSLLMLLSVISITAIADDDQWTTVELDGTKKVVEIEWDLEQDMWHWFEIINKGEDEFKFTIIGTKDQVLPEGVASPGIGMGIGSKAGSEPLTAGKYTVKIESLGKSNLKGIFKYKLSAIEPIDSEKVIFVEETKPIIVYNTPLKKVPDEQVAVIWAENPDNEIMYELQKYGIIEGDPNGDFRPYTTITRAEMAKVLCKVLGLSKTDNGNSTFSDMTSEHWAYGYVEAAYASGLIDGNDDGTFAPDNDVKFSEAVKMIVTALGYKPLAEQRGGFPYGYAQIASQNGITKDIDHALDVPCKRNIVFKMLHNALDVPCMIQTGFGENVEYSIANGKNGTPYQTLRTLITGTEINPVQQYDEEYMNEIKKFMENGEYYDKIVADVGRYRNHEGLNIKYTFEIISVEINEDATEVTVNTKITPENSNEGIKYLSLNYKKVDGKWKF